ncbi:MAG: family 1 glycosylhydrolase [Acidimicrobiales bacterium]
MPATCHALGAMQSSDETPVTTSSPAGALVPPGFLFGVATAGFQVEGGFNGPGEPANNWAGWERAGRVEPSGIALDFWNSYEQHLDRVAAMGCNTFRMSVEWARVETEDGHFDIDALDRYVSILGACHGRGLTPLVTLHHFTHPAWLGEDLWLSPGSPERYLAWVRRALEALGDACRHWVTINELNVLAIQSYLIGMFPPGRVGDFHSTLRVIDNLLTAHVLAYQEIHSLQPDAVVSTNNYAMSIYELDRLFADLLRARSEHVERHELGAWLADRRHAYHETLSIASRPAWQVAERLLRRMAAARIPLERSLPRATSAVYSATSERLCDVNQLDYYDPVIAHHLRLPGHRTAGGTNWLPGRMLWDDPPDPPGLARYAAANQEGDIPLWVVENGMCNRVRRGRSYPRLDGWSRPRYMTENLASVVSAIDAGIPVEGYWHWTLADNYEWGSYEPRFGIFGIDRERGARWMPTDSLGNDSASAYRRLISGLRAGDRSVLS